LPKEPVTLPPPLIGTSSPVMGSIPICRLKKSRSLLSAPRGKLKTPAFSRKNCRFSGKKSLYGVRFELLRVYVGVGEICVNREVCYQIRAQPKLHIYAACVQSTQAWRESRSSSVCREMTEANQSVWLHDKQTSTSNLRNTVQLSRLTDPCDAVNATPA